MRYRESKRIFVFGVLVLVTFVLIFFGRQGILRPIQSMAQQTPRPLVYVFQKIGNSFGSFFSYFSSVARVSRENAELKEQVRVLQQEKVILQQHRLENENLRKELAFRQENALQLLSAAVIGKDPTGFSQTLVINAGTDQNVRQGAAVLSQGVFVGKIVEVNSFTSKVMLITDPQSTIDAQISSTGDTGIIRGSYGFGMVLDMISQNAKINKGDEVVTLGLTADVPKGLLVGTVGEFQSNKNDLLQKATVVPSVDVKDLTFVSVVQAQ